VEADFHFLELFQSCLWLSQEISTSF